MVGVIQAENLRRGAPTSVLGSGMVRDEFLGDGGEGALIRVLEHALALLVGQAGNVYATVR